MPRKKTKLTTAEAIDLAKGIVNGASKQELAKRYRGISGEDIERLQRVSALSADDWRTEVGKHEAALLDKVTTHLYACIDEMSPRDASIFYGILRDKAEAAAPRTEIKNLTNIQINASRDEMRRVLSGVAGSFALPSAGSAANENASQLFRVSPQFNPNQSGVDSGIGIDSGHINAADTPTSSDVPSPDHQSA